MKKSLFNILLLLNLSIITCNATNYISTAGARATAMGNCSAATSDQWSSFNNQAGMAYNKDSHANIGCENRFGMKEFATTLCGITLPTRYGVISTNITYFGFDIYHEAKLGIGFAKPFGENFSIGLQADILDLTISGSGFTKQAITLEGGIQYKPAKNITIGLHTFNPTEVTIGTEEDNSPIPTITRIGISYKPSENLTLISEAEQRNNVDIFGKFGLEYVMEEWLKIRFGYYNTPSTFTCGIGTKLNKCYIDISYQASNARNRTPAISLHCLF